MLPLSTPSKSPSDPPASALSSIMWGTAGLSMSSCVAQVLKYAQFGSSRLISPVIPAMFSARFLSTTGGVGYRFALVEVNDHGGAGPLNALPSAAMLGIAGRPGSGTPGLQLCRAPTL